MTLAFLVYGRQHGGQPVIKEFNNRSAAVKFAQSLAAERYEVAVYCRDQRIGADGQ